MFTQDDYCLFTSRTTVGSDNFFNFNQFPYLQNLNIKITCKLYSKGRNTLTGFVVSAN